MGVFRFLWRLGFRYKGGVIMSGVKHDAGKPQLSLIPIEFTIALGKVLAFGATKYGAHNFRGGITYARLLDAAERHMKLEIAGVEQDKDSGLPHWAHAAASLAMYAFMKKWKPELDDRFTYTDEQKKELEKEMYGE